MPDDKKKIDFSKYYNIQKKEDEETDINEFLGRTVDSTVVDPTNFFFPTGTLGQERAVPTGVQPTKGRAENTGFFGSLAQTKTGQALAQPIEQINQATSAKAVEESPIGSILETINAGVGEIFSSFSALEAFVSEQPDSPQKFLTEGLVKGAFALPKLGGFLGRKAGEKARDVGTFLGGELAKVAKDNLSEEQIKKLGGLAPDPKNLNRILEGLISTAETEGAFLGGAGLPKVLGKGAKAFKELPKTTRRGRVEPAIEPIVDPRRGRVEEPLPPQPDITLKPKAEVPEVTSLDIAKSQIDAILTEAQKGGVSTHNQVGLLSKVNLDAFQKLGRKEITKAQHDAILDLTKNEAFKITVLSEVGKGKSIVDIAKETKRTKVEVADVIRQDKLAKSEASRPLTDSKSIIEKAEQVPEQQIVTKLGEAVRELKPIRAQYEIEKNIARKRQSEQLRSVQEQGLGLDESLNKELATLKGEINKPDFEPIHNQFTTIEMDALGNAVNQSPNLLSFQKVNAKIGLRKLFGKEGSEIPTPSEIDLMSRVFGKEFAKGLSKRRPSKEKIRENILDAINFQRTFLTAFDMSAPLRQGLLFTLSRPRQSIPAMKEMIKSFGSEKAFNELRTNIETRPNVELYEDVGLFRSDMRDLAGVAGREEAFMSKFAGKLPGVKQSQRAYIGFLNKIRTDVFDNITKTFKKDGITPENNIKAFEDLATYVNNATGRGSLGKLEAIAPVLNGFFFSPRNLTAKFQLFTKTALNPKATPQVRVEAWKDIGKTVGVITSVLALAKLSGIADVELDPRSSDFGKGKVGNTRIDLWGGNQQLARTAAQLLTGQTKSPVTGDVKEIGKDFPFSDRADVAGG